MSNYGESATIKTPEVGEVWKSKYGEQAHIIYSGSIVVFVQKYWITNYEYQYKVDRLDLDKFLKKNTYFGKSKGQIDDLFEVKDD